MKQSEMNIKEQYEPPLLQDICPVSFVQVIGTSGDDNDPEGTDPNDGNSDGGD
jgi:hypothetical protein